MDNKWMTPKTTKAVIDEKDKKLTLVRFGVGNQLGPGVYTDNLLEYGPSNNRTKAPMYFSRATYDETSDSLIYLSPSYSESLSDVSCYLRQIKNFTSGSWANESFPKSGSFSDSMRVIGISLVRPIQNDYSEPYIVFGSGWRGYLVNLSTDKYIQLCNSTSVSSSSAMSYYEIYSNMAFVSSTRWGEIKCRKTSDAESATIRINSYPKSGSGSSVEVTHVISGDVSYAYYNSDSWVPFAKIIGIDGDYLYFALLKSDGVYVERIQLTSSGSNIKEFKLSYSGTFTNSFELFPIMITSDKKAYFCIARQDSAGLFDKLIIFDCKNDKFITTSIGSICYMNVSSSVSAPGRDAVHGLLYIGSINSIPYCISHAGKALLKIDKSTGSYTISGIKGHVYDPDNYISVGGDRGLRPGHDVFYGNVYCETEMHTALAPNCLVYQDMLINVETATSIKIEYNGFTDAFNYQKIPKAGVSSKFPLVGITTQNTFGKNITLSSTFIQWPDKLTSIGFGDGTVYGYTK